MTKSTTKLTPVTYLLTGLSGFLIGGLFSWRVPSALLVPALGTMFYVLPKLPKLSLKQSIILVGCFFLPYHLAVLSWALDADIAGLVGVGSNILVLASLICLILMSLSSTLAMLPLGLVLLKAQSQPMRILLNGLTLAAAWVVCEWLRSVIFSLVLYGTGASIGDFWNFGSLGLGVIDTPLAKLSPIVGMYGLSFVIVFLCWVIAGWLRAKHYPQIRSTLSLTIIILIVCNAWFSNPSGAVIQGSVLQMSQASLNPLQDIRVNDMSPVNKDLIVLPEYAYIYDSTYDSVVSKYLDSRLRPEGVSVSVSSGQQVERFGTLEFRNNRHEVIDTHTKELLIPNGEYMPSVFRAFFKLTSQSEVTQTFDATRAVQKGHPARIFKSSAVIVGPVACSGILGRNIYRDLTNQGAEVLTNSAALTSFNRSRGYFKQSLQMARFHAIANDRVFVQATKAAPAFVINSNGSYIVKPGDPKHVETAFTDFDLIKQTYKTPYTRLGDWPLMLSFLGLLITSCKFGYGLVTRR